MSILDPLIARSDHMADNNQDKREYYRLIYLEDERPSIKIGRHKFKVMDISQGGLRFLNPKRVTLAEWVKGKLFLTCGDIIEAEGRIEWVQDDEFGLLLKMSLTSTILEKERLFVFH
jgi:hypothetical protein